MRLRKWMGRRKRKGRESGQAMVEMALILPVLLLILFGIIEFGRIMSTLLVLENIARDAARYGVTGHTDQEITDLVLERGAVLDASRLYIDISPSQTVRSRGQVLTVSLRYSLPLVCPVLSSLLPNPFPLTSSCSMMVE